jgi:pimeloyl-ACP methyl ester carboxylesterase
MPLGLIVVALGIGIFARLWSPVLYAEDSSFDARGDGRDEVVTVDHLVPHLSTVFANAGQLVHLFVREQVRPRHGDEPEHKSHRHVGSAVLMIAGSTQSAMTGFDLPFQDYSWMAFLARAGFDVFAMDLTGYGLSPRPEMENACNAASADQTALLIPNPLPARCSPSFPFTLTTSQSDWDEIDTVVDFIRELRHVRKVSLIGWSLGGPRAGGYAARHPEKVRRLVLYAPNYNRLEPSNPPPLPQPGVPLSVRTIASVFKTWDSQVKCANQFTAGVRDALRASILDVDPVGRTWGTPPNSLWRVPVQATRWGWNPTLAALIEAPTLVIRGDLDTQVPITQVSALFEDLAGVPDHKVFVQVACAAHQLVWENQHMILLDASRQWLHNGTFDDQTTGSFFVDTEGVVHLQ